MATTTTNNYNYIYDYDNTYISNFTNFNHSPIYPTDEKPFSPLTQTIILVFIIFIFIFALIGNSLVLYAVLVSKKTTINLLIANHAVAGIGQEVTMVPYYNYYVAKSAEWFGEILICKFWNFSQSTVTMVAVFTIVALSCYNCREVISPLGEKPAEMLVFLVCLLLWGVAAFLSSPYFIYGSRDFDHSTRAYYCYFDGPNPQFNSVYFKSVQSFEYILPLIILILVFSATWQTLHKKGGGAYGGEMLRKREQTKMLTTIAILFVLFHLPYNLFAIFVTLISPEDFDNSLSIFTFLLMMVPASLNPVVYLKMGSDLNGVMAGMRARVRGWRGIRE